jgi:SNF2 family DNA or RNA helicase
MIILHGTWSIDKNNENENGLLIWAEDKKQVISSIDDHLNGLMKFNNLGESYSNKYYVQNSQTNQFYLNHNKLIGILSGFSEKMVFSINRGALNLKVPALNGIPILSSYFNENSNEYDYQFSTLTDFVIKNGYNIINQNMKIPCLKLDFLDSIIFLQLVSDGFTKEVELADDLNYWIKQYYFANYLILNEKIYPSFLEHHQIWRGRQKFEADHPKSYLGWWSYILDIEDTRYFSNYCHCQPLSAGILKSEIDKANFLNLEKMGKEAEILDNFLDFTINMLMRLDNQNKQFYFESVLDEFIEFKSEIYQSLLSSNLKLSIPNHIQDYFAHQFNLLVSNSATFSADNHLWSIVLKLEPFENESIDNWQISFLLRNNLDTQILIPVSNIFEYNTIQDQHGKYFNNSYMIHDVTNFLYQKLHEISKIIPFVDEIIRNETIGNYYLSRNELFTILELKETDLEEINCEILLPKDFERKLIHRGKYEFEVQCSFSDTYILNYDLALIIKNGSEKIPLNQILELAESKEEFVEISGKWIHFDFKEAKKIKRLIDKYAKELTILDTIRIQSGDKDSKLSELRELESNVKFQLNFSKQRAVDDLPDHIPNFRATLRDYQKEGVSWLLELTRWQLSGCLSDDMGLGKTIQVLCYLQCMKNHNTSKTKSLPFLIIVPTSILNNWMVEAEKFTPSLKILKHYGRSRQANKKGLFTQLQEFDGMITTYGSIYNDHEVLSQIKWNVIIIDEAQEIKNSKTILFKHIAQLSSKSRFALTGTPIENRLDELWSIFHFLLPGYLYSLERFKISFANPITEDRDTQKMEILKKLTDPFILRRSKTDKTIITDLPGKIEKLEFCPMSKEQISLYKAIMEKYAKLIKQIDSEERSGLILSTITKLKQACNHPSNLINTKSTQIFQSGKLIRLKSILTEILAKGEKVLIFTQYKKMGDILQQVIMEDLKIPALFINGSLSLVQRQKIINDFNFYSGFPILILTLHSAGTGLNLTSANNVIHFDRWWNPSVEKQATDRAYRIGQTNNVTVYKFLTKGTIEERINEIIENKSDLVSSLVSCFSKTFTRLKSDQLYELMELKEITAV